MSSSLLQEVMGEWLFTCRVVLCDRRLPITARLSAVCKVVPPSLQVYFRVLLKEAPPHYIGKR